MNIKMFRFLIVLCIPLLILLGMIVKPVSAYLFGEEIILETMPVDPKDLFYGDHIILNLAINDVPKGKLSKELLTELNRKANGGFAQSFKIINVYTKLVKDGDTYGVKEVSLKKPKNGIYVKGKISTYYSSSSESNIQIDNGLNRYYVEENTGDELEKLAQKGKVKVSVKVKKGYALVSEVIVDK